MRIQQDGNVLTVTTEYSAAYKDELKESIQAGFRRWDAENKAWVVSALFFPVLKSLSLKHFGREPQVYGNQGQREGFKFQLDYIGNVYHRGGGVYTASGHVSGAWKVVFPMNVLQDYFGFSIRPGDKQGPYSILAVSERASADDITKAYRRAARSWHPDVCKEEDAHEQFIKIKEAYDLLSDPIKRRKYDAARDMLEESGENGEVNAPNLDWKPPIRCGYLRIYGLPDLWGKITATKIVSWDDVTNDDGETLVSYWPEGDDMFTQKWVNGDGEVEKSGGFLDGLF